MKTFEANTMFKVGKEGRCINNDLHYFCQYTLQVTLHFKNIFKNLALV